MEAKNYGTGYSLPEIIAYLEGTKEESWCMDVVKTKDGRSCLFGHLFDLGGRKLYENFDNIATSYMVYPVNDKKHPKYQHESIKERCIAYLKDIENGTEMSTYDIFDEYEKERENDLRKSVV